MLRKLTISLLAVCLGALMYPDVSAREHDKNQVKSSIVRGSFVRAAINDITTWMVAPKEWRVEALPIMADAIPSTDPLPLDEESILPPKFAFSELVLKTSDKYRMDWRLVASVIAVESSFNPNAVSPKGARGLMQLMPGTATLYRVQRHELFDPGRNLEAGIQHLKWLTIRYPGDLKKAVAAYNSGEGAVDKYRGIPPYPATQVYVRKVMARYQNHRMTFPVPADNASNNRLTASLRLGAVN